MASRGVHVTVVGSTVDALVEFGRTNPAAVIAAGRPGHRPGRVRADHPPIRDAVRRRGVDPGPMPDLGELMLAGGRAVGRAPYDGESVWDLLRAGHALDDHA